MAVERKRALTPGRKTYRIHQGGRERMLPAPLIGEKRWHVMTESQPDVRSVLLHIQLGIEEVRQKLESAKDSSPANAVLLLESLDILKNIWEVTDAETSRLPTIIPRK